MNYYEKIIEETLDDLKRYGITYDMIDEYDMNDLLDFLIDYDVYDRFVDAGKEHPAYENFFMLLQEDVDNYVDFDKTDYIDMASDAIKNRGYSTFVEYMTTDGWSPIEKSDMPDTEEKFFDKFNADSEFNDEICSCLRNAVMYDYPFLGIGIFEGDGMSEFFRTVEQKLD